jgi:hypothetical protein
LKQLSSVCRLFLQYEQIIPSFSFYPLTNALDIIATTGFTRAPDGEEQPAILWFNVELHVECNQRLHQVLGLVRRKLLVGETTGSGFETLRGYKTHCFISTIKSLQRLNKSFEYTPSLFLSSVSFFSFHTE